MILAALALVGLPFGLATDEGLTNEGPGCAKPLYIGELRTPANPDKCIDIANWGGVGQIFFDWCDGGPDQTFIYCEDGSIRNTAINYCLRPRLDGNGNLSGFLDSQKCQYNLIDDTLHDISRWTLEEEKTWSHEIDSIVQTTYKIFSKAYPDWGILYPHGLRVIHPGQDLAENRWFFRKRGALVGYGRLVNWKDPTQVLDIEGDTGFGSVRVFNAEADAMDQVWALYETGEVVSVKRSLCLDIRGESGVEGSIAVGQCKYNNDQRWDFGRKHETDGEDTWFPIVNKKLEDTLDPQCASPLNTNAFHVGVWAKPCDWAQHQYFKWDNDTSWSAPSGTWVNPQCNMNGAVKVSITVSTTYETEITASIALSVQMAISAGFKMVDVETTYGIEAELAMAWSSSHTESYTTEMTCDNYDNDEAFTRGCMWQFQMETENAGKALNWRPMMTKCTKDLSKPKCPPFTKCRDKECTECIKMGDPDDVKGAFIVGEKTPEDKFKAVPLTKKKPNFEVAPHEQRGAADHRNSAKCSNEVSEDACDKRGDCKAMKKKGVMKKCKALKCSKMKRAVDCVTANKKCTFGQFGKCKKAKRKGD